MKILAHTCFIGVTGYANHAKSFFCALNKYHTVKVRNSTIGSGWKGMSQTPHDDEPYITDEMKDMLILQTLINGDGSRSHLPMYGYKNDFKPDVHIVLVDMNNYYFHENYEGYKIAFNVWESTRYPQDFFKRLMYFDEVWVPTQWQFDCLVEQGYPSSKISIVPEGVDVETFKPLSKIPKKDKFRFLHFGRWDYRKGTTEVLKTFGEVFKGRTDVELIASVENPYAYDGMKTTEERVKFHNINDESIKFIKFTPREEYVKYLQEGDVFVTCARSEGWNLPLIESMACGTPSIYSDWGGQLEFAEGKGIPVKIDGLRPANVEHKNFPGEYCEPDWEDLGEQMLNSVDNYKRHKSFAMVEAAEIHQDFNWNKIAKTASEILMEKKTIREDDFYKSGKFYTDVDVLENLGDIKDYQGGTLEVADKFGWPRAIYHEIFNLMDYYKHPNQDKRIYDGDVVVDLGGNIGIFNRWAYNQGASKVISFEPDRRYFELLSKNADPRSILFNGAIADEIGELVLSETGHLGGSTLLETNEVTNTYAVKTYTLNHLFETGIVSKIDFLKVDIEGAEHHAFAGISDENLLKVRNVAMEYHHNLLGHNVELRESLIQRMRRLGFSNYTLYMGEHENLQMLYFERKLISNRKTNVHFVDGPFVEINEDVEHSYNVQFIDGDNGKVVYETNIKSNHWTRASKKYYVNWIVKIKGIDNDFYREEKFNPEGQRIMICFESKSLGDSLAWMPYVEKFRIDKKSKVVCSTFKNDLFKGQYPEIEFVEPGTGVNNLYGLYRLGLFYDDNRTIRYDNHPSNPKVEPLGKMATDILGLEYEEIRPKLPTFSDKKKKRVCIAVHSTSQCKYWNNRTGWQQVVNHLKRKGYEVRLLSREEDGYMGNKNPQGVVQQKSGPIEKVIQVLEESELFIGIGSGLSWLAWSVGIPCVIISGFSEEYSEPTIGVSRIINKDVCHGCWNVYDFNPGDWNWCPVNKGTPQQFECSKSITGEDVIKEIDKLI
jgi:autotransporter strand-loop-strand O-heptosyltransferase